MRKTTLVLGFAAFTLIANVFAASAEALPAHASEIDCRPWPCPLVFPDVLREPIECILKCLVPVHGAAIARLDSGPEAGALLP